MAFNDWNNNGKYDFQDSFIDYHIYRSIRDSNNRQGNSTDSGGCLNVFAVGLFILGILMIFM